MAFNRFYVISPLALVAVSACRSPFVSQNAVNGAVVKGPLNNALVFLDYDDDGTLDADEPFARTNSFGEYELSATQSTYTLIAMADDQTVDTSSGAALSGITLKAPSGAAVITPTTTLMEEGNITAAEVATVLGLPDGVNPLEFNPFNVDENDAAAVAAALEVEKISQQIMTAVTSFASAAEGAGAGEADAFTAALGSVVDVVKAKAEKIDDPTAAAGDKELDFTSAADLALIKTEATSKAAALDGIDAATMTALADDTTDAIKNVNDKIATVTDLDADATKDIFSTMQVLKDQVKEAAEDQKAGRTGDITFKNSAAVDAAALNSAPTAITLSGDRLVSADGELVVGTVATIDSDQTSGVSFTYTLAGNDAAYFDFDASSGELSLKAAPNYASKPYYEITIITKDEGGKKFAETFIIDVVPEFGALGDPDQTVASDFEMIMKQNPLFMQMNSEVELKQTSDGQLVLMEVAQSGSYGSTSGSQAEGPIVAFIKITDEGYALHNPATDEYMGGFFTYTQGDLTYTGYEVLVDDMSILAEYDANLTKYFDPESTYGTGKLTYTARDIEYVAIVGAKAVDKDGVAVQDMFGFSHYDKDMNVLGSAGIDVTNSSAPYYIEVVGEYDPAVSTNITSTAITDANVGLEMQTLLQTAGEAVLYGDDHSSETPAINGGGITTGQTTESTTGGGSTAGGGTVAAVAFKPLKPLDTVEYDVTVVDGKYLIDGALLQTLDLEEGKTYRFNQSDSSNSTHLLRFSEAVDGTEFTKNVVTFGTPGSADAFSQITIPFKSPDLHIICENHTGMGFPLTTSTNFVGTMVSGELELKYVAVNEFESDSYLGELVYDETAYPNASFTTHSAVAGSNTYPFKIEGTSVFLQDGWAYHSSFDSGGLPHMVSSSGYGRDFADTVAPVEVWVSITDGPGSTKFFDIADAIPLFNTFDTPLITMEDFSDSGNELGATLGTFNFGFNSQFVKPADLDYEKDIDGVSTTIDRAPFEIVGDKLKLSDDYAFDPSNGILVSTSGDQNHYQYTNEAGGGAHLNTINIHSFATQSDMDNNIDPVIVGSIDVSSYFSNVNPAPITYFTFGSPTDYEVDLHAFDDRINAILPENKAAKFLTDDYYSTTEDSNLVGDDTIITFSFISDDTLFTDSASDVDHRPRIGTTDPADSDEVFEFSNAHKAATRKILSEFSKVADLYFIEVDETVEEVGTMRFGFTDHYWGIGDNHAAGWASSPGGGDVWIFSDTGLPADDFFDIGSMGAITMLHEVGHALGLNHSFEGNLFSNSNLYLDSNQYTVMSYSSHSNVGVWVGDDYVYTVSDTPMLLDIASLQFLYGSQETTNADNTTYTFDDDMPFAKSIWDWGGTDLLDFSNFTTDLIVNLNEQTSSTIPTTIPNGVWEMTDNLGISAGTLIENITAGSGDDTIEGNFKNNLITGGAGDDTLTGGRGNDVFDFTVGFGNDVITDFVVGTDKLKIKDAQGNILTSTNLTDSTSGADLIITLGSDDITLEGLAAVTFDNTFLEIV